MTGSFVQNQATGVFASGLFYFNSALVQSSLLLIACGLGLAQQPAAQTGQLPDDAVVAHETG